MAENKPKSKKKNKVEPNGYAHIKATFNNTHVTLTDKNGNVIKGEVIIRDTLNSYIDARNHMFVAIGLKNIVVVDTPDVTLIASKEKANEVTKALEKVKSKK